MFNPKNLDGTKEETKNIFNIRVSPMQVKKADFLLVQLPSNLTSEEIRDVINHLIDFVQTHDMCVPLLFLDESVNVIAIETNGLDELKSMLGLKEKSVECVKCKIDYTDFFIYDQELDLCYCADCFKEFSMGQELFEPSDDFREKYEKGEAIDWNWKQTMTVPDVCEKCGFQS